MDKEAPINSDALI